MPEKCTDPNNCPAMVKVDALANRFDDYRKQSHDTHGEIFDRLNSLERSESRVDQKLESMDEKLDKLLTWKDAEKDRPARSWDKVRDTIITVVVTAIATYIMVQLGLK